MAIRRCPYCKAIIDEAQKYCNNCGTQLLFPEDESAEEPVKGEKIRDADFRDEEIEGPAHKKSAGESEGEVREIDLEDVLSGTGHFPSDAKFDSEPEKGAPEPEPPPPPARTPKWTVPPKSDSRTKADTREEIARLIAALEAKEERPSRRPTGPVEEKVFEPPASKKEPTQDLPPWAGFKRTPASPPIEKPEPPSTSDKPLEIERRFEPPAETEPPIEVEPPAEIEPPAEVELPAGNEPPAEYEPPVETEPPIETEPPAEAADSRMDFQREPYEPPAASEPTRMGIPEKVEDPGMRVSFEDSDEIVIPPAKKPYSIEEEAPEDRFDRRIEPEDRFDRGTATEDRLAERPQPPVQPRRPRGLLRRVGGFFFDLLFIAVIWVVSTALAARLMGVSVIDLVNEATVPLVLYFAVLLAGYFFLFLFFLGETLGIRASSPKE